MEVEIGPSVLKARSDKRSYRLIKLRNGLVALLISDPDVEDDSEDSESDESGDDSGGEESQPEDTINAEREAPARCACERKSLFPRQWPLFPSTCTALGGDNFMSETKLRLPCHADEEGVPNRAKICSSSKRGKLRSGCREERKGTRLKENRHWSRCKHDSRKTYKFSLETSEDTAQEKSNKNAAAALCVGVGSMSDPPEAYGLAHFLEHMLFMGCTKFPDENEYDKYLSKHGGGSNAYTDQELTNYHFEVRNKSLRGALERFSQFFISPLVKAEAMDRELQAIEAECVQAAGHDMNRLAQVLSHTAYPSHPFHRFSWGNRKSLHDEPAKLGIDMRAQILQLYHDRYQAGCMKLVVLGGGSLETLQKWVVELFSEIKAGGHGKWTQSNIYSQGCRIWEPNLIYRVAAVSEQSVLVVNFPLPCQESAYLSKPEEYCGHLVGHEGQGGLLALLKRYNWAKSILAGCGDNGFDTNCIVWLFSVSISLTPQGTEHIMEVIGLLFQYLKMLKSIGPKEWVFQELKTVGNLNFEYFEEVPPDQYAIGLASNLFKYSEAHVIYGEHAHDMWKPQLISDILSKLTVDNMRVDLLLHSFDRTSSSVQIEPWFETPFTVETIPPSILKWWAEQPLHPAFHMPMHNKFIPRDFTILSDLENALTNPSCVLDSAGLKVWYRGNRRFKTPRVNAGFSIMFSPTSMQIEDEVFAQVYIGLLCGALRETTFMADFAKLHSSIAVAGYRIEITIFGFSNKLHLLAKKIANQLKSMTLTQEGFESQVQEQLNAYRRAHEKPMDHAESLLKQVLSKQFWDVDHKAECLKNLTFKDFTKFVANIYSKTYIECFIDGNAKRKEALAIAKMFKEALVSRPLPLGSRPKKSVLQLPAGKSLLYKMNCRCEFEKCTVVQSYFQIGQEKGKNSIMLQCFMDLFEGVMTEPCFNQLRTKEQLGYVVEIECGELHGVLGISFIVQSTDYSPQYVERRINAFIKQIPTILYRGLGMIDLTLKKPKTRMTKEEFQDHMESLIAEKQGLPSSLLEDSERCWEEIWRQRYLFDANKREAACLVKVTKKELIKWCRRYLGLQSQMRRHLCIYVVGLKAQQGDVLDPISRISTRGQVVLENIEEFKATLDAYTPMA